MISLKLSSGENLTSWKNQLINPSQYETKNLWGNVLNSALVFLNQKAKMKIRKGLAQLFNQISNYQSMSYETNKGRSLFCFLKTKQQSNGFLISLLFIEKNKRRDFIPQSISHWTKSKRLLCDFATQVYTSWTSNKSKNIKSNS